MKVTAFLIKYGEIAIKGKNRYMFEDALMKQIRHAMAPVGDFKVRKESGRMFVEAQDEFDYDEAVEALQRVFGIVGICPMIIEENKDMEHLTETVINLLMNSIQSRILHSRFMQEEEINSSLLIPWRSIWKSVGSY